MMTVCKGNKSLVLAMTVFLSVLILGGCTTIKYSYDMKTSFSEPKSYTWAPSMGMYVKDPLLETNVQVLADQIAGAERFDQDVREVWSDGIDELRI